MNNVKMNRNGKRKGVPKRKNGKNGRKGQNGGTRGDYDRTLTNREMGFWLLNNSVRGSGWIFHHYAESILGHDDVVYYERDGTQMSDELRKNLDDDLKSENVEYVYSVYLDNQRLIAIISTKSKHYYVIKNINEIYEKQRQRTEIFSQMTDETKKKLANMTDDERLMELENQEKEMKEKAEKEKREAFSDRFEKHISSIWMTKSLKDAIKILSSQERKLLMIKKSEQMKFSKIEHDMLNDQKLILPIDFAFKTNEELVNVWKRYLEQGKDELQLSDIMSPSINSEFIDTHSDEIENNKRVKKLFMNQNENIDSFDWLRHFPNIEDVMILYTYQLTNDDVADICRLCPNLKKIRLSRCFRIDGRILLDLFKLPNLQTITLDDPELLCQKNTYSFLIKDDEWEGVMCESLKSLYLGSETVTNDLMSYVFDACPNLETIMLNDRILYNKVLPYMINGNDMTETVKVIGIPSRSVYSFFRQVKVKTTARGISREMFSESMKRVIERNRQRIEEKNANTGKSDKSD
jgi:hypothetical protein